MNKISSLIIIVTFFAVALLFTGCDSSTESGSEWFAINGLDYEVFAGDFDGYTIISDEGEIGDVDTRDWQVYSYRTSKNTLNDYWIPSLKVTDIGFEIVCIEWTTETETDVMGFYCLRSIDPDYIITENVNLEIIPATNTPNHMDYKYYDYYPYVDATSFYFVKMVRNNDVVHVAGPLSIIVSPENLSDLDTNAFRFFANPFDGKGEFLYNIKQGFTADVVLYNATGDDFLVLSDDVLSGKSSIEFNAGDYSLVPGLYRIFYRILDTNGNQSQWGYGDIMYDPDYEW